MNLSLTPWYEPELIWKSYPKSLTPIYELKYEPEAKDKTG